MAPEHIDPDHIQLDGMDADHVAWTVGTGEDDFDADALERAMIESREAAYRALRDLDAA